MSGRDVKPRLPRMPGRARPSLIAAAHSQPEPGAETARAEAHESMDVDAGADAAPAAATAGPSTIALTGGSNTDSELVAEGGSGASTPLSATGTPAAAPAPKMKFKPKMPVRRAVQAQQEDVKPDISGAAVRGRPAMRARGRGGSRGGARAAPSTIAAGPFGGTRTNCKEMILGQLVY